MRERVPERAQTVLPPAVHARGQARSAVHVRAMRQGLQPGQTQGAHDAGTRKYISVQM